MTSTPVTSTPVASTPVNPALETLLKTQRSLWRGTEQHHTQDTHPTGYDILDKALPGGGWSIGALTEVLPCKTGIGEFSLLLPALKTMTRQDQWVALINPPHIPYAPALANAGIALQRLLIVDTGNDKDTLWSTEQLLRTGTFSAVICWINKTTSQQQRRLQLAAENGHCWAVAYRNAEAVQQHSPAALRLSLDISREKPGLQIDVIKARGGANSRVVIQPHQFDNPQGVEWPVQRPVTTLKTTSDPRPTRRPNRS